MISECLREIEDQDLEQWATIYSNSYPNFSSSISAVIERFKTIINDDKDSTLWGLFNDDKLLGGMRIIEYDLNYFGEKIKAGGLGSVAVDPLARCQGVARKLVDFYLKQCNDQKRSLAILYPFRPQFYYQMGFGYGAKTYRFKFQPASLAKFSNNGGVFALSLDDLSAFLACYDNYAQNTHGCCFHNRQDAIDFFKQNVEKKQLIGFEKNNQLQGYLAYHYQKNSVENLLGQELMIKQWIWNTDAALKALTRFLYNQRDQVSNISFTTQDPNFIYLLTDPRDISNNMMPLISHKSSDCGLGIMYRVVDLMQLWQVSKRREFSGPNLMFSIAITDSFKQEVTNYLFEFQDQRWVSLTKNEKTTPHFSMSLSDFSSLLMGAVTFYDLFIWGKIIGEKELLIPINQIFASLKPPYCITTF